MASRIASFSLTNYSDREVASTVTVRSISTKELSGDPIVDGLPPDTLRTGAYGLIAHRCDRFVSRDNVEPRSEITLKYAAKQTHELALVVDLFDPAEPNPPRVAAFAIEERRSDGNRGGIVVVVSSDPNVIRFKPIALAAKPSPLQAVSQLVFMSLEYLDSWRDHAKFNRRRGAGFLGVEIVNASKEVLRGVVFYLECVSIGGLVTRSRVYKMGQLRPNDRFFAVFPLDLRHASLGPARALFVTYDEHHDRTRIAADFVVVDERFEASTDQQVQFGEENNLFNSVAPNTASISPAP